MGRDYSYSNYALPLALVGVLGGGCGDNLGEPAAIQQRLTLESFANCDDLEKYIEDQAVRDMQLQLDCLKDGSWCGGGIALAGGVAHRLGGGVLVPGVERAAGVGGGDQAAVRPHGG